MRKKYIDNVLARRQYTNNRNLNSKRNIVVSSPFKVGFILAAGAISALALAYIVTQVSVVVMYVVFGFFIALGLDPLVRFLERKKMPRVWAIAIVFILVTILAIFVIAFFLPSIVLGIIDFINNAPQMIADLREKQWYQNTIEQLDPFVDFDKVLESIISFVTNPQLWTGIAGKAFSIGLGVANAITGVIIILVLSLYFLASLDNIKTAFYSLMPRSSRKTVSDITERVAESVGHYVNGMIILAFMNAVLGYIAMIIIGVPYAGTLAVCVFFIATIPLIGSVMATILVVTVSLFSDPQVALGIGIYYLIYMQIEAYYFTPKVMNKTVSVPGSLVLIGALAGGTLLGLLGVIIAIPVTVAVLMVIKQVLVPNQEKR